MDAFAAVELLEFTEEKLPGSQLSGFAAPASGPKPCALGLIAGTETIGVVRATRFSDEAARKNIRRGWCGFLIGGLPQGLALGTDLELRCLVSNRSLRRWPGPDLAKMLKKNVRAYLSVNELRKRLHIEGGCTDIEQVLPFALDLAQSLGSRALLAASYQYLHGRPLDSGGEAAFMRDFIDTETIGIIWKKIMAGEEFRARRRVALPGPFDPGFEFPLDGLSEQPN